MKTAKLLFIVLLVLLVGVIGCQREKSPVEPTSAVSGVPAPLAKITLPAGVTVTSAILSFYPDGGSEGQTIDVYRITSTWSEGTVTWNTQPTYTGTGISFTNSNSTWNSVDITSLVQGWVDGTYDDYGVLLKQPAGLYSVYASSEWITDPTHRPKLEITYLENGITRNVTLQEGVLGTVEDSYIYETLPDQNDGNGIWLFVGLYPQTAPQKEKDILIKFDVTIESQGCTHTPGYWKTHSQQGPAPYDDTWAGLGSDEENTTFFLSGQTYYGVLWTSSAGGNAYYILARAYIAAVLNKLDGASVPAPVDAALVQAKTLFETYTPAQVGAWKPSNSNRGLFISLATLLDDYNNGLTGPGHCPDDLTISQVMQTVAP